VLERNTKLDATYQTPNEGRQPSLSPLGLGITNVSWCGRWLSGLSRI